MSFSTNGAAVPGASPPLRCRGMFVPPPGHCQPVRLAQVYQAAPSRNRCAARARPALARAIRGPHRSTTLSGLRQRRLRDGPGSLRQCERTCRKQRPHGSRTAAIRRHLQSLALRLPGRPPGPRTEVPGRSQRRAHPRHAAGALARSTGASPCRNCWCRCRCIPRAARSAATTRPTRSRATSPRELGIAAPAAGTGTHARHTRAELACPRRTGDRNLA